MDSDRELVERSRAGDEAAFARLYARHAGLVRTHLMGKLPVRLRKRLSLADVMQDTFTTAFERLPGYRGDNEHSFRSWLLQIAVFKARETARFHFDAAKRALGNELSRHQRPVTGAFRGSRTTPSRHAMNAEETDAMDAALAQLPSDYQLIIQLVHRHGFTMTEAGEQMEKKPDAARKLYGRAVAKLGELLDDQAGYGDG